MNLSTLSVIEAQTATGSCGYPGTVLNANKHGDDYSPGGKVRYQCHQGYRLVSGQLVVTCLNNSTWAESLPVCEKMSAHISAAIIGSVMGVFLVLVVVLLPIDFCLFKRRKMIISERRNAKKRDRSKGRPAPFLTYHNMSAPQNIVTLTVCRPMPSNGHLPNELLPPPGGRNGLLEPIGPREIEKKNGEKRSEEIKKSHSRFSYLRKKRVAPSIEIDSPPEYPPRDYPSEPRDYPDLTDGRHSVTSSKSVNDNDSDDDVIMDHRQTSGYTSGNDVTSDNNYDPLEGSTSRYFQEHPEPVVKLKKQGNMTLNFGKQEIFSTGDHKIDSYPPPYSSYDQYGKQGEGLKGGAVLYGNSHYV